MPGCFPPLAVSPRLQRGIRLGVKRPSPDIHLHRFSSQLEGNAASPPLRAPHRAGEEPELLPPPTGCSPGGPEGIQRYLGRNSGIWGEFRGVSGGKGGRSREGSSRYSTALTSPPSSKEGGRPKTKPERGGFPSAGEKVPFFLVPSPSASTADLPGFPPSKDNAGARRGSSAAALGRQKKRAVG